MKIKIIDAPGHFASSLVNYLSPNHIVEIKSYTNLAEEDLNADIWFFALRPHNLSFINNQEFLLNLIEKFQGKLCYVDVFDNGLCPSVYNKFQSFFNKVFCAFLFTETDFTRSKFRRRILYPKFTINYIPPHKQVLKNNKVYFRGSLTGGNKLYGKNHRIEALKILNSLNVSWVDCKMYATESLKSTPSIIQLKNDAYSKQVIDSLPTSLLQRADYLTELCNSTSSLCLPGNAVWCFRHLESMALNCNIISVSVDYDPGYWLGRDKLDDCFNILNFDLSNLQEVCEYTLSESATLKEKCRYAYNVYQQYYELTPTNCYKLHIWTKLNQDMQKHLILP